MRQNRIDVIIPAYKAQKTIFKTLCSIAEQNIAEDLDVTIVNDCDPTGDYTEFVELFEPHLNIREIRTEKNGGCGVARQFGIDNSDDEFFTCVDADDTLCGTLALYTLRETLRRDLMVKCAVGGFVQIQADPANSITHTKNMVWMHGKMYRRSFINKYGIRFNTTRANEDVGFNTWVKLLCDNDKEKVAYINECVYYWHNKTDSITRINDNQYTYDQCFCGYVDNMIYAINNVRRQKPFCGTAEQYCVAVMVFIYFMYVECVARKPVFAEQNWEYCKKFYHECYQRIEQILTPDIFAEMYSVIAGDKYSSPEMRGILPHISIQEFMQSISTQEYDPKHIFEIWQRMAEDPTTKQLIKNNEECGVCDIGYAVKGDKQHETEK